MVAACAAMQQYRYDPFITRPVSGSVKIPSVVDDAAKAVNAWVDFAVGGRSLIRIGRRVAKIASLRSDDGRIGEDVVQTGGVLLIGVLIAGEHR